MNEELIVLKEQMLNSLFRIRSVVSNFHTSLGTDFIKWDISINELIVMRLVQYNVIGSDKNTRISNIQSQLNVSKAAVLKMLGVLEKKGYICRDIDKENRRNLIITLTPEGKEILKELEQNVDALVEKIMLHMGKEQSEQFVESFNNFASAAEDVINAQKGT